MNFGYGRIEAVAAVINYTTLIVIGLYLVYEAALRFFNPSPVTGWIIVIVAGVALLIDLATAALTYLPHVENQLNIRAAFLHNLADAPGSVAVIVAGTLVLLFGWHWVDPAATLLIAGYILWQSCAEMPSAMRILMLGSPPDMDTSAVIGSIQNARGVASVHHVHLWMMGEHDAALDAHVVLQRGFDAAPVRAAIKAQLAETYHLHHTTLEMEHPDDQCKDSQTIGHSHSAVR